MSKKIVGYIALRSEGLGGLECEVLSYIENCWILLKEGFFTQ